MLGVTRKDTLHLSSGIVLHGIPELEKYWAFNVETGDQYDLNSSAYFLLNQFSEPMIVYKALLNFAAKYKLSNNETYVDCLPLLTRYLKEGLFERRLT